MPYFSISTSFRGGGDQVLRLLHVGRFVNPGFFASVSADSRSRLQAEVPVPIGLEITNDDSYYKFNLDYVNLYSLIRLETALDDAPYLTAYALLRGHTFDHQNAFFNMIDRGLRGPNSIRDSATLVM